MMPNKIKPDQEKTGICAECKKLIPNNFSQVLVSHDDEYEFCSTDCLHQFNIRDARDRYERSLVNGSEKVRELKEIVYKFYEYFNMVDWSNGAGGMGADEGQVHANDFLREVEEKWNQVVTGPSLQDLLHERTGMSFEEPDGINCYICKKKMAGYVYRASMGETDKIDLCSKACMDKYVTLESFEPLRIVETAVGWINIPKDDTVPSEKPQANFSSEDLEKDSIICPECKHGYTKESGWNKTFSNKIWECVKCGYEFEAHDGDIPF